MTTSTMFLNALSCVDHAYIDQRGNVVGGSFHPSFLVEGEVEPKESVVVDFSTVKKQMKGWIDDKEAGFDHKLWVVVGFSKFVSMEVLEENIRIVTPTTILDLPRNAVKVFECKEYSVEDIGKAFQDYLNERFAEQNIQVRCFNSDKAITFEDREATYFRYIHGLKDSTSWGCQNIAHGHLSYVQPFSFSMEFLKPLADQISEELKDTLFINAKNIVESEEAWVKLEYSTERGKFSFEFKKDAYVYKILQSETTIEFLVDWIKNLKCVQEYPGVFHLFVSEGLSKGAYTRF